VSNFDQLLENQRALADAQAAFAASQQDVTRLTRERDEARAERDAAADAVIGLGNQLADLRAETDRMRTWQVARNDLTMCAQCGRQIRRGWAVEPMPGTTTKGTYRHVHCPANDANAAAKAIEDERTRVRAILVGPLLLARKAIPDGEIRNGCYLLDGAKVREELRQAFLAVRNGANATPDSPRYPAPGPEEGEHQQ